MRVVAKFCPLLENFVLPPKGATIRVQNDYPTDMAESHIHREFSAGTAGCRLQLSSDRIPDMLTRT